MIKRTPENMQQSKKMLLRDLSLALVLGINVYLRLFPVYFPQLIEKAATTTMQKIYRETTLEVKKKHPGLTDSARVKLTRKFIAGSTKQNERKIEKEIKAEYLNLKKPYQDDSGQTYLMELDCWNWARYVDNTLRLGHPGDKVINGSQYDALTLAPSGGYLGWEHFLFYLSSFLYKIFSLIKTVPLPAFLFYLPVIFSAIFITALFCFSYARWGNLAAIISCLFVGLAPVFLKHSSAGWFDMDILNLLFPLLVVWTYLKNFEGSSIKSKFLWLFFSAFWVGLFSFTWKYWWFIFLIIILSEFYSLAGLAIDYWFFKDKRPGSFKQRLFSLLPFLLFCLFWIVIFSGPTPLTALYSQVQQALLLNKPLNASLWPNVLSTVQELEKGEFMQIAALAGGTALFIPSLCCMLILFLRTLRKRGMPACFECEATVIFAIWFLTMFFACSRGIRFTLFLLLPLAISLGRMISEAYRYFKERKNKLIPLGILAISIFLSAEIVRNGYRNARTIYPLINDNWYKVLTSIKEATPPEAILNSWWDFGDWFKAISRRRVIFDGQNQNTPQAYWMAKALLADDERMAIGILRMLDNGANQAFETLNHYINDPFKSVALLERILPLEPVTAREALSKFLSPPAAEEIIKLLFASPGPAYFIVDPTLLNKINPISYLGNWDFGKVYLVQNLNKKNKNHLIDYLIKSGQNAQEVEKLYQEASLTTQNDKDAWVSRRLMFYGGIQQAREQNRLVLFDNGLVYHPLENRVYFYSSKDSKYKIPKGLFIQENAGLREIIYPDSDLDFSVLILKEKEDYRAVLLSRELTKSLLVRLYFLNGAGLKHFKPFIEQKDGNGQIKVFEINWE